MLVKFEKTYTNGVGRKFHQFNVKSDDKQRSRTFDIIVRKGRRELELMSKAQAKARAIFIFSMGDEIEGMTQQLVRRYQLFGESELKRCYQVTVSAGIEPRWVQWLVDIKDPLASEPGTSEWRFVEFVKREAALLI